MNYSHTKMTSKILLILLPMICISIACSPPFGISLNGTCLCVQGRTAIENIGCVKCAEGWGPPDSCQKQWRTLLFLGASNCDAFSCHLDEKSIYGAGNVTDLGLCCQSDQQKCMYGSPLCEVTGWFYPTTQSWTCTGGTPTTDEWCR